AMSEPVILASQVQPQWKAPQFVWQVRQQLGTILCGQDQASNCPQVDTGGYTVTTTLNYSLQQSTEKWLYLAARATQAKTRADTVKILNQYKVPKSDQGWILNLRGDNINNDAGVVIDYRTGQVLAYGGSAGYYLPGTKSFQPQYDVLSDGFRQMGSAVKPVNYVTAIDSHAITASTVLMDVVTNFGGGFTPQDADKMERGPVRARSALQFSLNIPAIKVSMMNGLNYLYQRTLDFGFVYPPSITGPVPSMAIGTLEMHAIDLTSAFGAIADSGKLMPRSMILQVKDRNGNVVYPAPTTPPATGKQLVSPQAAYIVSNILEGNTDKAQNAYWARWTVYDNGKRRPAGYKTGTTDDAKDVTAFGFVAPPTDPKAPAIVVGVWMGNSNSTPTGDLPSTMTSAPLWNHIMTDATKGTPIVEFKKPSGLVTETVDAYSGQVPGPYTVKTVSELFISGTQPKQQDTLHVATQIDSATGLLWQDGCTGPQTTKGFLDFSHMEPAFPAWQQYTQGWAQRAAKGSGVRGGPKNDPTVYFFDGFLVPFGRTWGGSFAPTDVCTPGGGQTCGPPGQQGGGGPFSTPEPCPTPGPSEQPTPAPTHGHPSPAPSASPKLPVPTVPP
ncbi:MAG TPA: penicillin-binding transpeptidase domain-containing protein, partial [Candidatus Limnocylindrales bacterium]|nr:penicillin-binding transpeptidase domain-containing protein [Candidatus Limnocylindrales bacterium]